MSHKINIIRVLTAATGNSTPITLGAAYSQLFMTPAEAGAMNGRTYTYLIVDGNDWELGKGAYTSSGTTLARTTVLASRISGTLGTSRISLSGTAQVRFVESAEDMDGVRGTRAVTGTSDVIANSDQGYVVTYSNAASVAVSLAQAAVSNLFIDGWATTVQNIGAGTVTITPATSTINGASTLVLAQNMGAFIWSDGTNYHAYFAPVTKPLLAGNNLSDLTDAAAARTNLGGTTVGKALFTAADAAAARTAAGATTVGAAVLIATDQSAAQDTIGTLGANLVVNPQFQIDQFGSGSGVTTADNSYFADVYRYLGEASATTYALLPGGKIQFTGTTDKGGLFQVIESVKSVRLQNQTVTLSAVLSVTNTRIGNIKMGIVQWTGTADATTSDPISSWGADGTTPTLNANWSFVNTPGNLSVTTTPTKYSVTGTVGASTNNLALLIWNDDKSYTAADGFNFTDIDLHAGQDRPYRPVDPAYDMNQVLRYSEPLTGCCAAAYSGTVAIASSQWVAKRIAPTLTLIAAGILVGNGATPAVTGLTDPIGIKPTGGTWTFSVSGVSTGAGLAWRNGVIAVTARL